MQDAQAAGQSLESAAEDVNRMGKQQQTDEQKKEMLSGCKSYAKFCGQQGKGGKEQMDRMQRFGERARGGGKQPGQNGKPGSGSQPWPTSTHARLRSWTRHRRADAGSTLPPAKRASRTARKPAPAAKATARSRRKISPVIRRGSRARRRT